jgi:hypothetical protein
MRVHSARAFAITTLLAATALLAAPAWAQHGPPSLAQLKGKTAGQFFKNIKVLNNVPATKLIDGMHYITMALNVRCEFCHNIHNFASDQKRTKRTARKMMRMLFAIDKDNFHGHTVVSCYTCHHGYHRPIPAPLPGGMVATAPMPGPVMPRAQRLRLATGTHLPTLNQILTDYANALGGREALGRTTSRVLEVARSSAGSRRPPIMQKIYEAAPNKLLIVTQYRGREFRTGYNGSELWEGTSRGARQLWGMEAVVPSREAQLDPLAAIQQLQGARVVGMARIGDHKTYVVMGRTAGGMPERLFFDTETGLLLRRMMIYRTIFGPLLFQADYSEYRKEGGVAIPFKTAWWGGAMGWTETVKSVQTNVPVKETEFQPPASHARTPQDGPR